MDMALNNLRIKTQIYQPTNQATMGYTFFLCNENILKNILEI